MPKIIEFTKADEKSIVKDYKNGIAMSSLAEYWECSPSVIRRVLAAHKVTIRTRGGNNRG